MVHAFQTHRRKERLVDTTPDGSARSEARTFMASFAGRCEADAEARAGIYHLLVDRFRTSEIVQVDFLKWSCKGCSLWTIGVQSCRHSASLNLSVRMPWVSRALGFKGFSSDFLPEEPNTIQQLESEHPKPQWSWCFPTRLRHCQLSTLISGECCAVPASQPRTESQISVEVFTSMDTPWHLLRPWWNLIPLTWQVKNTKFCSWSWLSLS